MIINVIPGVTGKIHYMASKSKYKVKKMISNIFTRKHEKCNFSIITAQQVFILIILNKDINGHAMRT